MNVDLSSGETEKRKTSFLVLFQLTKEGRERSLKELKDSASLCLKHTYQIDEFNNCRHSGKKDSIRKTMH